MLNANVNSWQFKWNYSHWRHRIQGFCKTQIIRLSIFDRSAHIDKFVIKIKLNETTTTTKKNDFIYLFVCR